MLGRFSCIARSCLMPLRHRYNFSRTDANDRAKELNKLINETHSAAKLLDIYNTSFKEFDSINYSTILKRMLAARSKAEETTSLNRSIQHCIVFLKGKIGTLNNFTFVQLVVLAKQYHPGSLDEQVVMQEIQKRSKKFQAKELNRLLKALPGKWSIALLVKCIEHLQLDTLEQEELVNFLHHFNEIGYPGLNDKIFKLINPAALRVSELNLLLSTVLKHKIACNSAVIIDAIVANDSPTLRDIANFMDCLADHHIVDIQALQRSKDVIFLLTKITARTAPDDLQSKLIPEATARDCTQLLAAFVRLDAIDGDTFDVLETNFINNMDKSSEETLLNYLKAHSRVCQRLMRNISLEDINGSEKVASPRLARIKKYNERFYNRIFAWLMADARFTALSVIRVLEVASRPRLTSRATKRLVVELCQQQLKRIEIDPPTKAALEVYLKEYSASSKSPQKGANQSSGHETA